MIPKLAAIDLDGTLLRSDMTISDYSRSVIQKAVRSGMRIVVATGRMASSASAKARDLAIGDVPVICYTGAWVVRCQSGEILSQDGLPAATAEAILALARKRGWFIQTFLHDDICLPAPSEIALRYQKYRVKQPVYLGDAFWHPKEDPTRLIIIEADLAKKDIIRHELEEAFGDAIEIVYPGDDFIEIHRKGVSKGTALRRLCQTWSIDLKDTVAFGNSENDVSMLTIAGISYAVEGSEVPALKAAEKRAPSNDEDGVAKVLEAMLKEKG